MEQSTGLMTIPLYADPAHTGYLEKLEQDVIDHTELEGKQHGEQNRPNTEPEFRAMILNYIQAKVQDGINKTQELFLPVSGMVIARKLQAAAQEKIAAITGIMHDKEHVLAHLVKERDRLKPNLKRIRAQKLALFGMGAIAVMDGVLSYRGFRFQLLPWYGAIMASAGVAAGIYFGAHYLGGYIKRANTVWEFRKRYALSLVPYLIGFSWLAMIRAEAYNHTTHYAGTSTLAIGHTSALGIAAVSFLLYWLALFLGIHFYKTKEEEHREQAYEDKCTEVQAIENEIQLKKTEIIALETEAASKASLALGKYEYALSSECRLKNFAKQMAELYKTKNLRYRTDGKCPEFFAEIPEFQFTTFFDNVKPKHHENND